MIDPIELSIFGDVMNQQANKNHTSWGMRIAALLVMVMIVAYLPLAFNYMWPYFSRDAPALQNGITASVVSASYATGAGSLDFVRYSAYLNHRWVMLVHTTLGGLALVVAILQFLPVVRHKFPALHRWSGRVYFSIMSAAMVAAIFYLSDTPPMQHWIGVSFQTQVWALAVYTLATGGWAAWAARKRDFISHQAWVILNIALMLTAPLLRAYWIFVAPLWSATDLLSNMGAGGVVLGILAPAGAAIWLLNSHKMPGGDAKGKVSLGFVDASIFGSVASMGGLSMAYYSLVAPLPIDMLMMHLLPLLGYMLVCAAGRRRSVKAGMLRRAQGWDILFRGACTVPVAMLIGWLVATPLMGVTDGFIAMAMVLAPLPIAASYVKLIAHIKSRGALS